MVSLGTVREQFFGIAVPWHAKAAKPGILLYVCAVTMIACLLLGGGTRGGFLSDAILELLAIPPFLLSLAFLIDWPPKDVEMAHRAYWGLALCFAIALLPLLQLVPLPPWIWTRLPGREGMMAVLDLLDNKRPWMPISMSPNSTRLSVLSLLPPMAVFIGAIQLGYRERRRLSLLVVAFGVFSVFVGLAQVAQGPTSSLRFFAFTNNTDAVGFFANRNHFAALLYAALVFAAAWAMHIAVKIGSWNDLWRFEPRTSVPLTASVMVVVVFIVGEIAAQSRAGLILTVIALAGGVALAFAGRRTSSELTPRKLVIAATIAVVILGIQFGLYRILGRFAADPLADARIPFAHNTIRAALAFMPFGSGVGTFVPVYQMFEKPSDAFPNVYANHAHNDILEIWLETGVIGMALLGVFVGWMGLIFAEIWRKRPAGADELDWSLARAATIIIGLLIAHSFVDYPLRTTAMMAIFAFSCALFIEPLHPAQSGLRVAPEPGQQGLSKPKEAAMGEGLDAPNRSRRLQSPASPPIKPPAEQVTPRGGRWGEDIEWPDAWRKSKDRTDDKA